jgi:hypothetical protein
LEDEEENIVNLDKQDEVLKKIESWESNEIDLTDEEIDQAIAEFNQMEILEAMEESSPEPDEAWDVGIDPIDKDDDPVYQTDSKELDKMLDIVDDVIDEKKK